MPSSNAHFSKQLSSTYKLKISICIINFVSDTQYANFVQIFLLSLLNFYFIRCILNDSMIEIVIDQNRIVKVSKCKANSVMLFGLRMLSVCQLYDTKSCDICRDVKVGFKVLEVRINILFSGH